MEFQVNRPFCFTFPCQRSGILEYNGLRCLSSAISCFAFDPSRFPTWTEPTGVGVGSCPEGSGDANHFLFPRGLLLTRKKYRDVYLVSRKFCLFLATTQAFTFTQKFSSAVVSSNYNPVCTILSDYMLWHTEFGSINNQPITALVLSTAGKHIRIHADSQLKAYVIISRYWIVRGASIKFQDCSCSRDMRVQQEGAVTVTSQ